MGPKGLVVAIDGPAGAGKSTVARELARAARLRYVDTGAMYRVVGVLARERGVDPNDGQRLGALAAGSRLRFVDGAGGAQSVLANGRDVTAAIRDQAAANGRPRCRRDPAVRERLVAAQRAMGRAAAW